MRSTGFAVFASAIMLAACGGSESAPADTTTATTPAPTPAATTPAVTSSASAAPITGTTHTVNMVGDDKGYRFEPVSLTVKAGDGIKFVNVSGGPHNIAFDAATTPEDVKPQLIANIPNGTADMSSPMMMTPNETWTVSMGGVKTGTYSLICTPHLAMGMKMEVIVQ
jgi:plastocyanin